MLAILVPDDASIQYLLSKVTVTSTVTVGDMKFIKALYGGKIFLIIVSGYGKVNISRALTLACDKNTITCLLGLGTAGALWPCNMKMFSAVVCKSTLQYDVNFMQLGERFVTLPKMKKGIFPADEHLMHHAVEALKKEKICSLTGRIITDDCFVGCAKKALMLRKCYCGLAVDSECGALGQFAYMLKIPFTAIKVIADDAGCCAACQYEKHSKKANEIAGKAALRFLSACSA